MSASARGTTLPTEAKPASPSYLNSQGLSDLGSGSAGTSSPLSGLLVQHAAFSSLSNHLPAYLRNFSAMQTQVGGLHLPRPAGPAYLPLGESPSPAGSMGAHNRDVIIKGNHWRPPVSNSNNNDRRHGIESLTSTFHPNAQ